MTEQAINRKRHYNASIMLHAALQNEPAKEVPQRKAFSYIYR